MRVCTVASLVIALGEVMGHNSTVADSRFGDALYVRWIWSSVLLVTSRQGLFPMLEVISRISCTIQSSHWVAGAIS